MLFDYSTCYYHWCLLNPIAFLLSIHYEQAVAGSFGSDVAPIKVEPQVAVVCDVRNPLHPQYMDSTGKWVSDMDNKNSCLKDKIEILDFCRKVKYASSLLETNQSSIIVSSDWFLSRKPWRSGWIDDGNCGANPVQTDEKRRMDSFLFYSFCSSSHRFSFARIDSIQIPLSPPPTQPLPWFSSLIPFSIWWLVPPFSAPVVFKPFRAGSKLGISIAIVSCVRLSTCPIVFRVLQST